MTQKKESTLEEAQRLVHGDRGKDYGHPYDNDRRIAGQLRALFGWPVKVSDVWRIVAAIKLSREGFRPKRDNRVDLGGYAETGEMVQERIAAGWPDDPFLPIPEGLLAEPAPEPEPEWYCGHCQTTYTGGPMHLCPVGLVAREAVRQ